MASKKKAAPEWREGDRVAVYGKVGKVIGDDGREKIAVQLDGASYPVLLSEDFVHRAE